MAASTFLFSIFPSFNFSGAKLGRITETHGVFIRQIIYGFSSRMRKKYSVLLATLYILSIFAVTKKICCAISTYT